MAKKFSIISLCVLVFAFGAAFTLAPATGGQSQRGQCQQECERRHQECRRAANANTDACKQAFDACRARCQDIRGNTNERERQHEHQRQHELER